jgi:hypothetical protein
MKTSTPGFMMEVIAELTKIVQQNHVETQNAIQQLGGKLDKVEERVIFTDVKVSTSVIWRLESA